MRGALRTMVRTQLAARDITDRRVLAAMATVPRADFVPRLMRPRAYDDGPLPIGHDQTISQPYIVALMTQLAGITRQARVLEVGTGSGYQTAVLARLAAHVWSVERIPALLETAAEVLRHLAVHNVTLVSGDGAAGYGPAAPYDAIVVTAAAPAVPRTLVEQLGPHGRLVIPVGDRELQHLWIVGREGERIRHREACAVRFVPLVSPTAFDG